MQRTRASRRKSGKSEVSGQCVSVSNNAARITAGGMDVTSGMRPIFGGYPFQGWFVFLRDHNYSARVISIQTIIDLKQKTELD